MPAEPEAPPTWETVENTPATLTKRLRVPAGWLYLVTVAGRDAHSTTFVPFPTR